MKMDGDRFGDGDGFGRQWDKGVEMGLGAGRDLAGVVKEEVWGGRWLLGLRWVWEQAGLGEGDGLGREAGSGWRFVVRVWGEMDLGREICWGKDVGLGRRMVLRREMGWGG